MPLALYAASKAAATMQTLQCAKAQPQIKFNALEPGTTARTREVSCTGAVTFTLSKTSPS
jgi:NAD(P)-dependent dehydrogenase (short-subunit alcohol dehydrogenase family)